MDEYTKYEQAFGEGDIVTWKGYKYIVRECIQEDDNSWTYGIEHIDERPGLRRRYVEVPQDELKAI